MGRVVFAGFVLAAFVACRGDKAPTSPTSSGIGADDFSVAEANAGREVDTKGLPHSSNDVEALITMTHNRGHVRTCNGLDGFYAENHEINTGTVTGDPRLAGISEMRILELVHFGDDFWAPSFGSIVIRDAASGSTKFEGDYNAWAHGDAFEGTIVGRFSDGAGGGNLIANVSLSFFDNGANVMRIGGASPPETRMNAGIFGGQCSGKFTEYDNVVPPPPTLSVSAIGGSRAVPPLWRSFQR